MTLRDDSVLTRASDKTKRCVIYAAKSTEDTHGSIDTQLADCAAMAAREGWEIIGEFKDEGFSAYRGNRGPGLIQAKEAAARAATEDAPAVLLAQHSDRLARGSGDAPGAADHLGELWFAMRRLNVRLRSVQDDTNLEDPVRAILIGERNTEDSRRKSASVKSGKRRRFDQGLAVGGPVPDGYRLVQKMTDDGRPEVAPNGRAVMQRVIDPQRKPLIETLFAEIERGRTPGEVARLLNRSGERTRLGRAWTHRAVRGIVQNPYYAGWVRGYDDELVDGHHPRLLEPARWRAIVKGLKRNGPNAVSRRGGGKPPTVPYLLRGIARCPSCGSRLYTKPLAAGRHYICGNVRQATGTCGESHIAAEVAEGHILYWLHELVPDVETWIVAAADSDEREKDTLQEAVRLERERLAAYERERQRFIDQYRKHMAVGHEARANVVLDEAVRVKDLVTAQAMTVQQAEARLEEWQASSRPADAALDFYRRVQDVIAGDLADVRTFDELHLALRNVLEVVWLSVGKNGVLNIAVELVAPDPTDWEPPVYLFEIPQDHTDLPVPPWADELSRTPR